MANIASGTSGTCNWVIDENGILTISPSSGSSGTLGDWVVEPPWANYVTDITSCIVSGTITALTMRFFLSDCENITSVNISSLNTSQCTNFADAFYNCSKLTSLDLSNLSTVNATEFAAMFGNTDILTQIILGSNFDMSKYNAADPYFTEPDFCLSSAWAPLRCENSANGIVISADKAFIALTTTQRAGTWTRSTDANSFYVSAYRSSGTTIESEGTDTLLDIIWSVASSVTTTDRLISVYQKLPTDASYPSTPTLTNNPTGNSGNTKLVISGIGEAGYDYKVTFYDGTNTYIAYTSLSSLIRLVQVDPDGNVTVKGGITASGNLSTGGFLVYGGIGGLYSAPGLPIAEISSDGNIVIGSASRSSSSDTNILI